MAEILVSGPSYDHCSPFDARPLPWPACAHGGRAFQQTRRNGLLSGHKSCAVHLTAHIRGVSFTVSAQRTTLTMRISRTVWLTRTSAFLLHGPGGGRIVDGAHNGD